MPGITVPQRSLYRKFSAFSMLSRHASSPMRKGCVVTEPARKKYRPGFCTSVKSRTW